MFDEEPPYRARVARTKTVLVLISQPAARTSTLLKALKPLLYHQRGVATVRDYGGPAPAGAPVKMLLLDDAQYPAVAPHPLPAGGAASLLPLSAPEAELRALLPPTVVTRLLEKIVSPEERASIHVGLTSLELSLTYKNYTMPELQRLAGISGTGEEGEAAVPTTETATTGVVALSGFEQVGHIAHVNLSKAHLPHQRDIGDIIIDCNPSVSVVVNKTDTISSEFREFPMEVIAVRAGAWPRTPREDPAEEAASLAEWRAKILTASVHQGGCVFRVPYDKVYWNSRLCHEHQRLVSLMKRGDFLFDVMAGVGPFAVPAARAGVRVFANDLNPASAASMRENMALNKVRPGEMYVYNMDGRDFMCEVLYESVMATRPGEEALAGCTGRRHVALNLPAIAVEFMDVFSRAATTSAWRRCPRASREMGLIDKRVLFHVYCFSAAADREADAVRQVEHHLGFPLPPQNIEGVHDVRDVAPTKRMLCVSFTLPEAFWASQVEVAGDGGGESGEGGASPLKVARTA